MRGKPFIRDEMRSSYINAIHNRIRQGKSVLVTGKFGSGKSALIDHIKPKKRRVIKAESLAPLNYLLGSILAATDHDVNLNHQGKAMHHLELICKLQGIVVMLDEANDLRPAVWPYIKRLMNANIPVVLAGLPKVKVYLEREHEDILSRLKVLNLSPVGLEQYKSSLSDKFEPDALEIIFGASGDNMRVFDELCDDCLDKIEELTMPRVTAELAAMFI